MNLGKKVLIFSLVSSCALAAVFGGAWGYHGPKRDIVTLIVTANYAQPRLLADVIQAENRQPYLLIPAHDKGNLYFCPPQNLGKTKIIPRNKLSEIAYIAPKKIIVLGGTKYVPEYYVRELKKIAPVFVAEGDTWEQVAESLAPMLNLTQMPKAFKKLNAEISGGKLYVPVNAPVKAKSSAPVETDVPASGNSSEFPPLESTADVQPVADAAPEAAPGAADVSEEPELIPGLND